MNRTVPNAKNWPEQPAKKRLAAKRSGLVAIDQRDGENALRNLVRMTRGYQRGEPGHLIGFVSAFMYYDKETGHRIVRNANWGNLSYEEQIMLARKLEDYIIS